MGFYLALSVLLNICYGICCAKVKFERAFIYVLPKQNRNKRHRPRMPLGIKKQLINIG